MLKNYLKIAFRCIIRQKLFSLINILGLSVGLASCILIALYIINEINYDNFNTKADRIVRATTEFCFNGVAKGVPVTGTKVVPAFRSTFPEVETGVRLFKTGAIVKYNSKVFNEKDFVYADSTFFDIFSFSLVQGNAKNALLNPNSVVLTSITAKKYFGTSFALGKTLTINSKDDYVVTGVIKDIPGNSQIKFDFLASFSSLDISKPESEKWTDASFFSYLLLKTPKSIEVLQKKIPAYMKAQNTEMNLAGNNYLKIFIEPLKDVHLFSRVEGGLVPSGDYRYIYIFSLIAVLILIIACANYINITTARGADRAKEIGIRKVTGAHRSQLFGQFIGESFIIVFLSFITATYFIELLLPFFNTLTGCQLSFTNLFQPQVLLYTGLIILSVTLFGGTYPVLLITGFKPVAVLKGSLKTNHSGFTLRKGLIIVQFVISVSLIICALIIWSQLNYIQNKKLGFNKENIVVLPVDEYIKKSASIFKNEFLSVPGISKVTFASRTPVVINSTSDISYHNKRIMINQIGIDKDFLETVGIQILEGRNLTDVDFEKNHKENRIRPIMLNQTSLKQLNLMSQEAIGQIIEFQHSKCMVIAIVKDFHFGTMREKINPLILFPNESPRDMLLKISGNNIHEILGTIESKWNKLAPHLPFKYEFLDDQFLDLYKIETRTGKIFYVFSSLAIFLACLGLFGLISLSTQQRTKEIGIRKVLGADTSKILVLLTKDFLKLIIIANVLAFPVAYYFISNWLQNFAYRINISLWMFLFAGIVVIIISLATISFQAIKAASANMINDLKYE